MAILPPKEISFYPTQNYLEPTDKNKGTPWAGMRVPLDSVRALARSQAIAEHEGLVDPETAKYYLASALTEGRFGDYGVNQVDLNYGTAPPSNIAPAISKATEYDNQKAHLIDLIGSAPNLKKATQLSKFYYPTNDALGKESEKLKAAGYEDSAWAPGASYGKLRDIADRLGLDDPNSQEIIKGAKYGRYYPTPDQEGNDFLPTEAYHRNAALKTLALVNKIQESGKTGLDAWQAYNGSGPKARQYKQRVSDAYDNLSHEKNKDMWNAYQNMVKQYKLELKYGKK